MAMAMQRSARQTWRAAGSYCRLATARRSLTTLRVAGVPEHFNAPFLLAKERGHYEAQGIDFQWRCTPEGSGKMAQMLQDDEIDVALMVSEAGVAKVSTGSPFKVVGTYVQSPLRLGVHVKKGAAAKTVADLKGKVFGVSRMGSNSHLMSYVLAHQQGWNPSLDAPLNVVHTMDGARTAMKDGAIDAWVWEYFTTKHLVDSGEWDRVGEILSPWHPFLFIASERALATLSPQIQTMVNVTAPLCAEFKANEGDSTYSYCKEHHGLDRKDATEWLSKTEWACRLEVERNTLLKTQEALVAIGQLDKPAKYEDMIDGSICRLTQPWTTSGDWA